MLRSSARPNQNPLHLSDSRDYTISKAMTTHLLCEECEHRFSVRGENWVANNCRRSQSEFALRDVLERSNDYVVSPDGGTKLFPIASIAEIKAEKLIYFAMSVFWRAGVHTWWDGKKAVTIELGPYLEPLRLFLRDDGGFPEDMLLAVRVSSLRDVPGINYPESEKTRSGRVHAFSVPGITFLLFVQKTFGADKEHAIAPSPTPHIGISEQADEGDWALVAERFQKALTRKAQASSKQSEVVRKL